MKRQLCLLGAAALIPMGAMAAESNSELSYTYFEVHHVGLDIDGYKEGSSVRDRLRDLDNGDGWGARASFSVSESFFVFANYADTDGDVSYTNDAGLYIPRHTSAKKLDLGVGWHRSVGDQTDLVLSGGYTDLDLGKFRIGGSGSGSLDDLNDDSSDGFFADAAIRTQLTSWLEGSLGARYTDFDGNDAFSVIGNLMVEVTPAIGLNLGIDAGDDLATWTAGLRYSF